MSLDAGTLILLGVVALFALNRLLLSLPGWTERRLLFWAAQALNLAAACVLVLIPIPGLVGPAAWLGRVLAVLLVLHNLQASQLYIQALRARLSAEDPQEAARREEIRRALSAGTRSEASPQPEEANAEQR